MSSGKNIFGNNDRTSNLVSQGTIDVYTYGDIIRYSNSNRARVVVGVTGDTRVGVDGTTAAGDAAELHRVGSCGTTNAVSSRQYPP